MPSFPHRLRRTAALLALPCLAASAASAQDVEVKPLEELTGGRSFEDVVGSGLLDLNLAVPESPAFTALGLNPEQITRPASPREFATSVLTGLDRNGNFQAGLAVDTVPYLLIDGRNLSLAQYRENRRGFNWRRQLARTQLSLATAKGTDDDDESVRIGLGLRVTPWTRGDPRMDDSLVYCLRRASWIPSPPGIQPPSDDDFESGDDVTDDELWQRVQSYGATLDAWEPEAAAKAEACLKPAEARLNKASAWDIGLAPTWIQRGGSSSNVQWGGGTVWSSFAWDFAWQAETQEVHDPPDFADLAAWRRWKPAEEDPARRNRPQLITHARFAFDETVAARTGNGFVDQTSLLAGARLRWGVPRLTFSIDAAYLLEDPEGYSTDHSVRAGLAADVNVYEQLWIQLALGGSFGRSESRIQVGATFKWGGFSTDLSQIVGLVRSAAESPLPSSEGDPR